MSNFNLGGYSILFSNLLRRVCLYFCLVISFFGETAQGYYSTRGQDIIDIKTGEVVQLRGIGLGGWLLPEGYMWGIRDLDRPRQFEAAIEDLIGARNARKFWDLYYENFVTHDDVIKMKSWGVNTLRVPLNAAMIQPRNGQPQKPPYIYDEHNFTFIDKFVDWCEELEMGIIWDLHGAPGGQNAENISDSDGEARLWTESAIYWPRTIDLWDTITRRYASYECIVGYDLLNEPLLARYPGIDPLMLRELYVMLTTTIRMTDTEGIIFIEGDDWAQDFVPLEPMDWDPHLVLAFHSYPPTHSQRGLQRWDDFRNTYGLPLWHGETGEQNPPWEIYHRSTRFMAKTNVGWNWWTHKKFELSRQPWRISRTEGFEKILDYWRGEGQRPSRRKAKKWLFEQARRTNSIHCEFLPGMVASLYPLDPEEHVRTLGERPPQITSQPQNVVIRQGYAAVLRVAVSGYPLNFQWYRNGQVIPEANDFQLYLHNRPISEAVGEYYVHIQNHQGSVTSEMVQVTSLPFSGLTFPHVPPGGLKIDGVMETAWKACDPIPLQHTISGKVTSPEDLSATFRMMWSDSLLYFFIEVMDDSISKVSSVDHLKDGIEVYLDPDNSKSTFFDRNEVQLRHIVGDGDIHSDIGVPLQTRNVSSKLTGNGYLAEFSIPVFKLNDSQSLGQYLGLDVHVNDSDGHTRHGKISWYSTRDNAYQSPANFGTVKLNH